MSGLDYGDTALASVLKSLGSHAALRFITEEAFTHTSVFYILLLVWIPCVYKAILDKL